MAPKYYPFSLMSLLQVFWRHSSSKTATLSTYPAERSTQSRRTYMLLALTLLKSIILKSLQSLKLHPSKPLGALLQISKVFLFVFMFPISVKSGALSPPFFCSRSFFGGGERQLRVTMLAQSLLLPQELLSHPCREIAITRRSVILRHQCGSTVCLSRTILFSKVKGGMYSVIVPRPTYHNLGSRGILMHMAFE